MRGLPLESRILFKKKRLSNKAEDVFYVQKRKRVTGSHAFFIF